MRNIVNINSVTRQQALSKMHLSRSLNLDMKSESSRAQRQANGHMGCDWLLLD